MQREHDVGCLGAISARLLLWNFKNMCLCVNVLDYQRLYWRTALFGRQHTMSVFSRCCWHCALTLRSSTSTWSSLGKEEDSGTPMAVVDLALKRIDGKDSIT